MDSTQLNIILKKLLGDVFKGVFAIDELQEVKLLKDSKSWGIIVNTAKRHQSGEHWICICKTKTSTNINYFCSYGTSPDMFDEIETFLAQWIQVLYNPFQIQSNCSSFCGHFCVLFLFTRLKEKKSYETFLSIFSKENQKRNDTKAIRWFNQITQEIRIPKLRKNDQSAIKNQEELCHSYFYSV